MENLVGHRRIWDCHLKVTQSHKRDFNKKSELLNRKRQDGGRQAQQLGHSCNSILNSNDDLN